MPSLVRYPLPQPRLLVGPTSRVIRPPAAVPSRLPQTLPGLVAWQFAKDIVQSDATAVSQWDDSSGNARHATQATGTKQPIYRADAATTGFPAVQFDGTDDALSHLTSGYLAATNNAASLLLCGVVRPTALPGAGVGGQIIASSTGAAATNSRVRAGLLGSSWAAAGRRLDADTNQIVTDGAATQDLGVMVTVEVDWANSDLRIWVGRTLAIEELAFQTAGSTSATSALGAAIGSRGSADAEFFPGFIFDVYTYTPTLSAGNRTALWDWVEGEWTFLAAGGTSAAAQAATVPVTAADAALALTADAGTAGLPIAAADATASLTADAGTAGLPIAAVDATVSTTGTTNANAQAATVGVAAAAAAASVEAQAAAGLITFAAVTAVDVTANADAGTTTVPLAAADGLAALATAAGSASLPVVAADATPALSVDAGSATVGFAAVDATVSTTGTTNANAEASAFPVTAADAAVALTVDAGAAVAPVAAADALGGVAPAAETATVSVAAQDAATAHTADATGASLLVTAADATVSTASFTNADAQAASLPVTAADASVALSVTIGTATLPVTAADATVSAVAATNADAGPATVGMVAADASNALSFTAEAASIPFVAAGPGWGIVAGSATLSVAAADVSGAAAASADAASVPFAAADPTVFIPPPVPPPRWVEGITVATGTTEATTGGGGQIEGVLVGAGIVEGGSSV